MHKLESLLPGDKVISVSGSDCLVFDGHALIQRLPGLSVTEMMTFSTMASKFLQHIMHVSGQHGHIKQIHIVFVRYDKDSIKNNTRQKRAAGREGHAYHVELNIKVPKTWSAFLQPWGKQVKSC